MYEPHKSLNTFWNHKSGHSFISLIALLERLNTSLQNKTLHQFVCKFIYGKGSEDGVGQGTAYIYLLKEGTFYEQFLFNLLIWLQQITKTQRVQ